MTSEERLHGHKPEAITAVADVLLHTQEFSHFIDTDQLSDRFQIALQWFEQYDQAWQFLHYFFRPENRKKLERVRAKPPEITQQIPDFFKPYHQYFEEMINQQRIQQLLVQDKKTSTVLHNNFAQSITMDPQEEKVRTLAQKLGKPLQIPEIAQLHQWLLDLFDQSQVWYVYDGGTGLSEQERRALRLFDHGLAVLPETKQHLETLVLVPENLEYLDLFGFFLGLTHERGHFEVDAQTKNNQLRKKYDEETLFLLGEFFASLEEVRLLEKVGSSFDTTHITRIGMESAQEFIQKDKDLQEMLQYQPLPLQVFVAMWIAYPHALEQLGGW